MNICEFLDFPVCFLGLSVNNPCPWQVVNLEPNSPTLCLQRRPRTKMHEWKLQLFHVINQVHIKESSLICAECHNWLDGVIYSSDNKVYCAACLPVDGIGITYKNDILEGCLKDLLFPCKHVGCDYILRREEVADHETDCPHGPVFCHFCHDDIMNETDIIKHLKTEHLDNVTIHILSNPVLSVKIDQAFTNAFYIVKLFQHNFVARIQRKDFKLRVNVAEVKDFNGNNARSNFTISFPIDDMIYSYSKPFVSFTHLCGNENDVDMQVKSDGPISIKLELYNFSNCMDMPKCPVCFLNFEMEVYQCANGHNVCSACGKKIQTCAVCRSASIKTVQLKHLFSNVSMLCPNYEKGCMSVIKGADFDEHARFCTYRDGECIECGVEYSKHDFITHFKEKHELWPNFTKLCERFQHALHSNNCYVLFKNRVFLFKCTISGSGNEAKLCYAVQVLHCEKNEEAQRYSFQVHVQDNYGQCTRLMLKGLCQTTSNNDYSVYVYYNTFAKYFVQDVLDLNYWIFFFSYGIIEIGDVL